MVNMVTKQNLALGSIATVGYLRQAFAMALSLRHAQDFTKIFILVPDLVDQDIGEIIDIDALSVLNVQILGVHDLQDQPPELSKYYYNAFEYSNMLKPFLIMELLRQGFGCVTYLDSDLMFVSSLSIALTEESVEHVGFTPHLLSPQADHLATIQDSDLCQSGVLNGGFYVVLNTEKAKNIVRWMMDKFPKYGFVDYNAGLFVDQKLLQNAYFHFFPSIQLIRHPGYNIAYWNAEERSVQMRDGEFRIYGSQVLFFHLSGMAPDDDDIVCRYLNSTKNKSILDRNPWFKEVYAAYSEFWREAASFIRVKEYDYPYRSLRGVELSGRLRRSIFLQQSTNLSMRQLIFGVMRMIVLRVRKISRR